MKYLLLLYSSPAAGPQDEASMAEEMPKWFAYTDELAQAGVLEGGEALQMPDTATTLQVRNGDRMVTDGPFAETKEILGGFYMIDVPDLDAAMEWAEKVPSAVYGSVEIRPVMEFPQG